MQQPLLAVGEEPPSGPWDSTTPLAVNIPGPGGPWGLFLPLLSPSFQSCVDGSVWGCLWATPLPTPRVVWC